jgi:hypothetical protein
LLHLFQKHKLSLHEGLKKKSPMGAMLRILGTCDLDGGKLLGLAALHTGIQPRYPANGKLGGSLTRFGICSEWKVDPQVVYPIA